MSYSGILYFQTATQKLAQLNSAPGVFEYEVDAAGNSQLKVWAWTSAQEAVKSAGASARP